MMRRAEDKYFNADQIYSSYFTLGTQQEERLAKVIAAVFPACQQGIPRITGYTRNTSSRRCVGCVHSPESLT
ncbi:hypothetical protein EDI29_19020 [Pectobacterium polonicum]|nr:hypothetical protein EDI29_19020 [Pectobacterium polonicum]